MTRSTNRRKPVPPDRSHDLARKVARDAFWLGVCHSPVGQGVGKAIGSIPWMIGAVLAAFIKIHFWGL